MRPARFGHVYQGYGDENIARMPVNRSADAVNPQPEHMICHHLSLSKASPPGQIAVEIGDIHIHPLNAFLANSNLAHDLQFVQFGYIFPALLPLGSRRLALTSLSSQALQN